MLSQRMGGPPHILRRSPFFQTMSRQLNRYSSRITQPPAQGASQAMLYATGLNESDMQKAQVGIGSVWYEGNPCNMHLLDLATNKVLALAGRFEARDFIDAIYFERQGIALGLLAWAAAGEDPGPTPTLILENCRRFPGWNQANLPTCSVRQNWIMEAPGKTGLAFSIVHRRLWIPFQQPKSAASTWTRPGKLVDPSSHPRGVRHFSSVGGTWPRLADNPGEMDPTQTHAARRAILEQYRHLLESLRGDCDVSVEYNDTD